MKNKKENNLYLLAFILVLLLFFLSFSKDFVSPPSLKENLTYSQFLKEVEKKNVKKVTIIENKLRGEFKNSPNIFQTTIPVYDTDLIKTLRKNDVDIEIKTPSVITTYLPQLIWILFFVGLWFLFARIITQGGASQAFSFGKSRAKLITDLTPKITFDDVAGCDEAKEELKEIVEFLKNPKKFQSLGAKIPKGILLLGPPGTGKTLLSRAIAGEANVPFFHISGSDFVEMFVGVGASRVRDLFEQAKKNAPCLVFIDELDAVGRMRGAGLGGGHDEREQTLNQLLVEMDGFDPNTGIILLAATNRPDILDPALLRPGRFDRHIVVDKPDLKGREEILKVHTKNKPLEENVDLKVLARGTPGFSGADLANMVNEAALLAARRGKTKIGMSELEEAKERVIAGPERKSKVISDKEKEIISYHEAGHAIVAKILPNADPVHKISILPRGLALGYTMQLPLEDRYIISKKELIDEICVLLGGRVAEEIIFGEISTGAHNDLERATELSRKMVCDYGMSEKLGPLTLGRKHQQIFLGRDIMEDKNYSDQTAALIDMEIKRIIEECYQKVKEILETNKEKLIKLAKLLMERETLEGELLEKALEEIEVVKNEYKIS
jgi:cell division protease FtsH